MASFTYYRITNIFLYEPSYRVRLKEVRFKNIEGVLSNDSSKAFGTAYEPAYPPKYAFDSDEDTEYFAFKSGFNSDFSLGYTFPQAVTLTHVYLKTRGDYGVRQFSVEASNDGINWVYYGEVIAGKSRNDLGDRDYDIILSDGVIRGCTSKVDISNSVEVKSIGNSTSSNTYTEIATETTLYLTSLKEFMANNNDTRGYGYIAGRTYEKINGVKTPVSRKVYLHSQRTGKLVAVTWSNQKGEYLFKNVSLEGEFMITSIDHNKQFGLEGVAYKRAKEVVINNDGTLSYPISE